MWESTMTFQLAAMSLNQYITPVLCIRWKTWYCKLSMIAVPLFHGRCFQLLYHFYCFNVCWPNSEADCVDRARESIYWSNREAWRWKCSKRSLLGHLKCLFGMSNMFFCARTPSGNKPDEACDLSWPPSFLWDVKLISKQSGRVQADSFSAAFFRCSAAALSKAEFNTWLMGCLATVWPCHSASWQDTFAPISYCIVKLTLVSKCDA